MSKLNFRIYPKTIDDIIHLFDNGNLNLNPGFQRDSVWNLNDRKKLIDSILRNYPLPAVFFYKREEKGKIIYDVIDGKQRLETIFRFANLIRSESFELKTSALKEADEDELISYKILQKREQQTKLTGYNITVIEVDGSLPQIIDLFVRINSTGKALSGAEKRHSSYYNSEFLKLAARFADKNKDYLTSNKILSDSQISRMKHVEFISELLISFNDKDVINKKKVLETVLREKQISSSQINKSIKDLGTILNRIKKMFPKLKETRFVNLSDFYTLVVLIYKLEIEKNILTDKKRNEFAFSFLKNFSNGIDEVRLLQKKALGTSAGYEIHRNYYMTVSQNTDDITQRKNRETILRNILEPIFKKKDNDRIFSKEQRRIIWNSTKEEKRKCVVCKKKLNWEDFTIDHIIPYSKGGKTDLFNASLMCRKHNSAKGNKEYIVFKKSRIQ